MPLCLYFASQIGYTLVVYEAAEMYGDTSFAYAAIYAEMTLLILLVVAWLTWTALQEGLGANRVLWLLAALLMISIDSMARFASFQERILEVEASWLYMAGLTMLGTGLTVRGGVHRILGIFWMVQAAFLWAYRWHLPQRTWIERGYWAPAVICCIGFWAVGWLAGRTVEA